MSQHLTQIFLSPPGLAAVVFLWSVGGPGRAQAQETIEPRPPELTSRFDFNFWCTHDRGLYHRLSLGVGYLDSEIVPPRQGQAADRDRGVRLTYATHLAGFVAPRVAVGLSHFGQLSGARGLLGAGPSATLYVKEDSNLYVSLTMGAQTVFDEAPDVQLGQQWGLGGEFEAGTGWWISDHVTLGVSFAAGASALDLDSDDIAARAWHAGLRLPVAVFPLPGRPSFEPRLEHDAPNPPEVSALFLSKAPTPRIPLPGWGRAS